MGVDKLYKVICHTELALQFLIQESYVIGCHSKAGKAISESDALTANSILRDMGFKWEEDFSIKEVD